MKKRKIIGVLLLIGILIIILLATSQVQIPFIQTMRDESVAKELNEYLDAIEANRNFHGSVVVIKDNQVLVEKGYGMADYENNIPMTAQTKLPIASLTKQFIAVSIMQLVEEGKLNLDDKMSKFIPDYPRADEVTIKHLLTHTSGMVRENENAINEILNLEPQEITPWEIIDMHRDVQFLSAPGIRYVYSNIGYVILGCVIEEVTGMALEEYLNENIFEPLEMINTGVSYKEDKKMFNSKGYSGYLYNLPSDEENDEILFKITFGAAYLCSTAEDMRKWANALDEEIILSRESIDEMLTQHIIIPGTNNNIGYGYGFLIAEYEDGIEYYHDGVISGYNSLIYNYKDSGVSIIILTNNTYITQSIHTIKNDLYSIVKGQSVKMPEPIEEITLTNDEIERYEGRYYDNEGSKVLDIKTTDGMLEVKCNIGDLKGETGYLLPSSSTTFFSKDVPAEITFIEDSEEAILNYYGTEIQIFKMVKE